LAPDHVSSLVLQTTFTMDKGSAQNRGDEHIFGDSRSTTRAAPAKQAAPLVLSSDGHIPILCQRYLKVVHGKNPIFEVAKFNMHVQRVVEHGLDWDEDSCVVVSFFAHRIRSQGVLIPVDARMRPWQLRETYSRVFRLR
jgi:hypothetical protein